MDHFKYKGSLYVQSAGSGSGGGWKITKVTLRDLSPNASKGRIYFFPSRENVIEGMMRRGIRPHQVWRKLLPIVLKKANKSDKLAEAAAWSQKAGCSCGCSPGFVVEGLDQDISVSVKG